MPKSALRILLISLSLFFFGCGTYQPKNAELITTAISEFSNPYFADISQDYVYKANIEVYGRNLGGIVVIKKIDEDTHRVVFATDFGNKLLDFEVSASSFKLNFSVEGMDNKRFLKLLENDFRLLLNRNYLIEKTFANSNENIYESKQKRGMLYLFEIKEKKHLYQMIFTKKSKEKITFEFRNEQETSPTQIEIVHHSLPFRMQLMKI